MTRRAAGVLLHPTSLTDGGGRLVVAAERFLDWLAEAGFSVWQVLPLGPAGSGDSPYAALSSFAGDPRWFAAGSDEGLRPEASGVAFEAFVERERAWLSDWCLYAALKDAHGGRSWLEWDDALKRRDHGALGRAEKELAEAIAEKRRVQWEFFEGWSAIRAAAGRRGIRIMGDIPIYPALDSADVWAHQEMFWLDASGRPVKVAGVPPDYFSETGQLWGNPIYRWDALASTGYAWWVARVTHQLALHDALRLDHFRGFVGYWAVPAGAATAAGGAWEPGPGRALFDAIARAVGGTPFVAEDLGYITEDVVALRTDLALPGMRVLQFGLDAPDSDHAPHNLVRDVVVYTGTHDNDTAVGWFRSLDPIAKRHVLDYVGGREEEIAWSIVREAMTSIADLAIVPVQDLLGLGSEARMNVPGIANGNWRWRAPHEALDPALAARVRRLLEITGRLR